MASKMKEENRDIAIIGIGLKISCARDLEQYWEIIKHKIGCIEDFPKYREEEVEGLVNIFHDSDKDPAFYQGSYIGRIDEFDHEFFNISPREASLMDPVQRIFLETIRNTFDDAGYTAERLKQSKTGVFLGYTASSLKDNYIVDIAFNHPELLPYSMTGNMAPLIPSRISHLLDLTGPTMVMDTACSSSLVAVHEACEHILSGNCQMAVAGGMKLNVLPIILDTMKLGIESLDGKTRTFDSGADGASMGEGCCTVLLKPLTLAEQDGDIIYAVIKGTSINHDGTASGLTAPNPAAQSEVIMDAWDKARINPEDIQYIEAHGTATGLGDPIEIQGIQKAFSRFTDKKQFCAIGSSKSNLGHLYECAGIAALLKVIASMRHETIPATINFLTPNPNIDFINSPVYVNTEAKRWDKREGKSCIAGVSAFGLSGTNCHVVVEAYDPPKQEEVTAENKPTLISISAKSDDSLSEKINQYVHYVEENNNTLDYYNFCYNINRYNDMYDRRIAFTVKNKEELCYKLQWVHKHGLSDYPEEKIYHHAIVRDNRDYQSRKMQLKEMQALTDGLNKMLKSVNLEIHDLENICQQIVLGGTPQWELMYDGYQGTHIPLPVYPFQRTRLWLPKKVYNSKKKLFYKKGFKSEHMIHQSEVAERTLIVAWHQQALEELKQAFAQHGSNVETILLEDVDTLAQKKEEVMEKLHETSHIIFQLYGCDSEETDIRKLIRMQQNNLHTLLTLSQWIQKQDSKSKVKLVILSMNSLSVTGNEALLNPQNTTAMGLGKCITKEIKHIKCCYLDYDEATAFKHVMDEVYSENKEEVVVYRDHVRYVECLEEIVPTGQDSSALLVDSGVYIITGGLGGIGYETAKKICELAKDVTLIIISRTKLPFNTDMASADNKVREKYERYTALRHLSKNIEYYSVDVSQYDIMKEIIDTTRQKYGKINGIIHAAGIGGGQLIESTTTEHLDAMLQSKVYGAWNLDQLTKEDDLLFFVLFSSIATVFSSIELSAYTAANTYLDYFCQYRHANRCGKTYTINWATWSEIGMSVEHSFTIDTLFKTITIKDGIKGFLDVLGCDETAVIIGELNLESQIALMLHNYPVKYSDYIMDKLDALKAKNKKDTVKQASSQPPISYSGDSAYKAIEVKIAHACQEVLGYEEIDIHDNFFEMGADSILMGHIFKHINDDYPDQLQLTDLFAYPSVRQLSEYMSSKQNVASQRDRESKERVNKMPVHHGEKDIAVIGIGLDLPCAKNVDEYWELIVNGVSVVRDIPKNRAKDLKNHFYYLGMDKEDIIFNKCAYLDAINTFDYGLFNMSPREAKLIDPINRLFLQCSHSAIEDAGYGGLKIRGSNTGVFLGYTANLGNLYSRILYEIDAGLFGESLPVNQVSMAASRIAYVNDLKGPSMVIDTACSSSLVAIHTACQHIRNGECDMALVGGASITMAPLAGGFKVGFESLEEKTRSFSEGAMGTAVGEGVAAILLKPLSKALEDKDNVYGVIKGSSSNQDGSSFGIAAPNYLAQSEVIQKAWLQAEVEPETISYIEAHGTGTALGDPIEVKGITHAFKVFTDQKQFCALGTIKPNIGHLNEASGISGFIKVLMMMRYKELAPTVFFQEPNQNIDFMDSPVYMSTLRTVWETGDIPRRAGITGLGMSGTNCHIVLEEPPEVDHEDIMEDIPTMCIISAKYQEGLRLIASHLLAWLYKHEDSHLYDILYTLATGREHYHYRVGFQVGSIPELKTLLEAYLADEDTHTIYQGHYAIVSENKKNREDHEMTVEEHNALNQATAELVESITDYKDVQRTDALLQAYTKGADIDWHQLYCQQGYHLHLPTYPYKKEHCWMAPPTTLDAIERINFDGFYYTMKWMEEEEEAINLDNSQMGKTYMIFHSSHTALHKISDILVERGIHVIQVYLGEAYEKIDDERYVIGSSLASCEQLFEAIYGYDIDKMIHLASIDEDKEIQAQGNNHLSDYSTIDNSIEKGFYNIINLVKAMISTHYSRNLEFIIISQGTYGITKKETRLNPQHAVVLSIGKVIEQEYPNIECRAMDIQDAGDLERVVDEILRMDRKLYLIGFRDGIRYVECFTEETVVPQTDCIREDGNYIITGGLGDIGIETAKYLSEKGCNSITLLGRNGFHPRKDWQSPKLDDVDKKKAAMLKEIEDNGAQVFIYAVDVADDEGMQVVYQQIKNEVGSIHGIFHSAGIAGAGFIVRKDKEEFASVLAPKVRGTWILDQLTQDEPLDFMMLYSSAVTYSGEAGQSDYVGANAFLDAFADFRNARGDRTYVVNWVSWKETGMSVRYGINVDTITKAITTKQAIHHLDQLLQSSVRKVIIGQYNVNKNLLTISDYSRNRIAVDLQQKMDQLKEIYKHDDHEDRLLTEDGREVAQVKKGKLLILPHSEKDKNFDFQHDWHVGSNLSNNVEDIQENLCKIYAKILGYDEIDIYDNFFEMGGDSILLTRMHGYIDSLYPDMVNVANLFEYTSIYTLAEYIHQELLKKSPTPEVKEETIDIGMLGKYLDTPMTGELSFAQKRMYVVYKMSKNKNIYNNPFAFKLDKMESKEDVYHCIKTLMDRHDVLRTSFYFDGKSVCQRVEEHVEPDITYYYQERIEDIDYQALVTTFDLKKAPLFKVSIIELKDGRCVLFFDMHHIIIDGYSSSIINRELNDIITNTPMAPVAYQYHHYVAYEKDVVKSTAYKEMEGYWHERLKGYVRKNYLQDFRTDTLQDHDGNFSLTLSHELIQNLERVAKNNNTSLFSMFLTGINLTIHVFDSSEDIVLGVPCIGRVHEDVMGIVGMFTNTLPMRNYPVADKKICDFLLEVKQSIHHDLANQSYPYDKMVDTYKKAHKDGSSNLFNIMFDYESPNMDIVEGERRGSGDIVLPISFAKYDMDIQITNKNASLVLKVDFTKAFREEKVQEFIHTYLDILQHMTHMKAEDTIGNFVSDALENSHQVNKTISFL
ncbi:SDR family NAD(P)-dependent oxidoreductase [Vallitalea pronyensis]|uniref:SDR family NAD(P)-dependent oxidoreductase n=1 Tax=Vallitalea pronyensis TaxID=1348613 RepID=A0A8J8SFP6_9FIRM|nr:SDR family NAD(P)-dependent oxidoreductase [Vallitalea pronyensis]QUI21910.1 SDR family NAD(P)-dependent oxidoreductase [Vallitalea pronyensis]